MPITITQKDRQQYEKNIIDVAKENNQIGYLYDFYLDNKDNMRFLKTKCYYARNDQIEDPYKRKYDVVHVIYKDSLGLYDTVYYANKVDPVNRLFLLEENDELARQMIMEKLEERKLKIMEQISTLSSIILETSKADNRFDTI